ncbi:MAG: hypothetical protein H0W82_02265 [Actinobacteria bacterium]|nr:hypothetical protein [Actinomycetota bacterium]
MSMGAAGRRLRPEPSRRRTPGLGSRVCPPVKRPALIGGRGRRILEVLSFLAVFALSYAAVKYGAEWAAELLA